jgi:signal transduction histidine kinase
LSVLTALLVLILHMIGALGLMETWVCDGTLRSVHADTPTHVAVVAVDEHSLHADGPWPWDRGLVAEVVEAAIAAGARGVAVDLLLPEARPGDARLAQALGKAPSVLAVGVDDAGRWLEPDPALRGDALAHVSFEVDRDGVVRRFAATRQFEGRELPAFPVAAARLADPTLPVPVGTTLRPGFRARTLPVISASDLLAGRPEPALTGRIVFLGTTAAGLGDRVVTPVSPRGVPEPGVLVEAQATEAILAGDLLRPVPPLIEALLAFALAWLGLALLGSRHRVPAILGWAVALLPLVGAAVALRFHWVGSPVGMCASLVGVDALDAWARSRRTRRAVQEAGTRIAELEALQASLAEARKEEAEARRVVAHELKTPLTSVRGLAQLLAQYDLSAEERSRVAGMVVSEASRLAQMVDALLDLERLRLRDPAKEARPLDLSALCQERAAFLQAGTDRPFTSQVEEGLRVAGDAALLARVVENLVSNALKFSPEGGPIRLGLRSEGSEAILDVEDRGPGIPVDERTRIFGRFARGSTRGEAPGLGLGLALVAEVVAWHRGRITVEDGAEGGSCFRIRLSLIPAD